MAARRPRRLRLLVMGRKGLCYALGALVIAFALAQLWFFSHILYWTHFEPGSTAFMQARLEALRTKDSGAKLRREWMPYQRISLPLHLAVGAAEAAQFLDHAGFYCEP